LIVQGVHLNTSDLNILCFNLSYSLYYLLYYPAHLLFNNL
jgi:hypothetical protein